jgi:hypothetical protein
MPGVTSAARRPSFCPNPTLTLSFHLVGGFGKKLRYGAHNFLPLRVLALAKAKGRLTNVGFAPPLQCSLLNDGKSVTPVTHHLNCSDFVTRFSSWWEAALQDVSNLRE